MNSEDFERHLGRQPLRQVPAVWRTDILAAAREAASVAPAPSRGRYTPGLSSVAATVRQHISALLWPHPAAWAGLAALWLVIGVLGLATRDASPRVAHRASPPSAQVFVAFREQERLLAELLGPREAPTAERPKPVLPQPRSERRRALLMV